MYVFNKGGVCRCRRNFFGDFCENQCETVNNMTICVAYNNQAFERPHLVKYRCFCLFVTINFDFFHQLPEAEARVASALTTRCIDVVHALCSDSVIPARPCQSDVNVCSSFF